MCQSDPANTLGVRSTLIGFLADGALLILASIWLIATAIWEGPAAATFDANMLLGFATFFGGYALIEMSWVAALCVGAASIFISHLLYLWRTEVWQRHPRSINQ